MTQVEALAKYSLGCTYSVFSMVILSSELEEITLIVSSSIRSIIIDGSVVLESFQYRA